MINTTERFTIISDVEIPSYDISVRLYWTGDGWTEDPSSSVDMRSLAMIEQEAKSVKHEYDDIDIKILRIKSTTEFENINF